MDIIIIRIYWKDQVTALEFYLFCLGEIFLLIYFPSNKQQTVVQSLKNKYPHFFLSLEEYMNYNIIEVCLCTLWLKRIWNI